MLSNSKDVAAGQQRFDIVSLMPWMTWKVLPARVVEGKKKRTELDLSEQNWLYTSIYTQEAKFDASRCRLTFFIVLAAMIAP
jgi:hypothetical protein